MTDTNLAEEESEEEVLLKNDEKSLLERIQAFLKLVIILSSYAFAFISLAQWGMWISDISDVDPSTRINLSDWVKEVYDGRVPWNTTPKNLLINAGLLLTFLIQHSLMSERVLSGTKYWDWFHHHWKIDKAIYNTMTGLALQAIVRYWVPTSVSVWSLAFITDYFKYVHVLAWASFYGTNLMLDLPDLIGLNQVVISSPTITVKSPELRKLYRTQRHMGLLPFSIILLVYPYMRFLLTITSITYMYFCWRSDDGYQYASEMKRVKKQRVD